MNINEKPEELEKEEQATLEKLIHRMDKVIDKLDRRMQGYVREALDADISVNPDHYGSHIIAENQKKVVRKNKRNITHVRDELYEWRILLHYNYAGEEEGYMSINVGLHDCWDAGDNFVMSWKNPICRHFVIDNSSSHYTNVAEKNGSEFQTDYDLLVKNQVTLRFTHVKNAVNLFPRTLDDSYINQLKGRGFWSNDFLNKLSSEYNPEETNPEEYENLIYDSFLQELLERRSAREFKNIVFSIQKKQGEIIQAPLNNNIVVQGCAGSGKSMIMLHRLPILLYDNPEDLNRTNLYVITPSQMYIQLADNMRGQLEISDISMGTIEQYYDLCISKYAGHSPKDYGVRRFDRAGLDYDKEKHIYSRHCISDIKEYFEYIYSKSYISLEEAHAIFNIGGNKQLGDSTYALKIHTTLSDMQNILNANTRVMRSNHSLLKEAFQSVNSTREVIRKRKNDTIRKIDQKISEYEAEIKEAKFQLLGLDPQINKRAVQNRNQTIKNDERSISALSREKDKVESDPYFEDLGDFNKLIGRIMRPIKDFEDDFEKNSIKSIYSYIDKIDDFKKGVKGLLAKYSKFDEKYTEYIKSLDNNFKRIKEKTLNLADINTAYLNYDYYSNILEKRKALSKANSSIISDTYKHILRLVGVTPDKKGKLTAMDFSPYLYLQILYLYQGPPSARKETLLAIDEAQSFAPEEIQLLYNVNAKNVIFNLYGDVYQHIEDTKGIDDWNDFKDIINFDLYEMRENYRNASQITQYCNKVFGMKMQPVNTPGSGVHVLKTYEDFHAEMITQLLSAQKSGLSAILVGDDSEAEYIMFEFSAYSNKFHNMTRENSSIHNTRWNIININEAKGLEFSSVIVLSGRMSRNQQYIAFTRALDDLYVFSEVIDTSACKNSRAVENSDKQGKDSSDDETRTESKHKEASKKGNSDRVRKFFNSKGLETIDNRNEGGRLWVIGEKKDIQDIVRQAISEFGISGRYMSGKEINNRKGWCTKTNK